MIVCTVPLGLQHWCQCTADCHFIGFDEFSGPNRIDMDCRNRVGQRLKIFTPDRLAKESLVVDVHTPLSMRQSGKTLWPEDAAEMVENIARIMQKPICTPHNCLLTHKHVELPAIHVYMIHKSSSAIMHHDHPNHICIT